MMNSEQTAAPSLITAAPTRMVFCGDAALADGFRLIGFETYPDPAHDEIEQLVRELQRAHHSALLIIDERLMAANIPALRHVRREGGRIVVITVPPLTATPQLASEVADRLAAMFGHGTLN